MKQLTTRCCIAGGGPAGMMLGFLLARAGIETIVLEKWPDFFRDFRGDTIHPSIMEILHELDLLQAFLALPHSETYQLEAEIGSQKVIIADFSHLKVNCPFIAFIPQWDFLNFIAKQAQSYPHFQLLMNTEVTDLIEENNKVVGLRAKNNEEQLEIRADLIVGADGRHSMVREKSGLALQTLGAPMDVLWFRLSRKKTDPKQSLGKMDLGRIIIMIERGDYWQCGFLIRKGGFDEMRRGGIELFHHEVAEVAPSMADRMQEITSWEQVKLLEVTVDRLQQWHRSGLLCIGDAAHAMSPIGGVGINLAIQDAVASANVLIPAFLQGSVTDTDLIAIQKRRELPTRIIQRIQIFIQDRVINRVLGDRLHPKLPFVIKLLQLFPYLRRIPAYLVGIGFRPEHISIRSSLNENE
jgi:2-polyprenyl-6-methoxyphenol hydroxylase-like FAD-dependent oxidoreductase